MGCGGKPISYFVSAISRYWHTVLYKRKHLLTFKAHFKLIGVGWLTMTIVAVLPISSDGLQFEIESKFCFITTKTFLTSFYTIVIVFFVPLIGIIILYTRVVHYARQASARTKVQPEIKTSDGLITKRINRDAKVFHNILVLVGILIIGGSPGDIKKRASDIKRSTDKTGGGPADIGLDSIETMVIGIMGNVSVDGIPGGIDTDKNSGTQQSSRSPSRADDELMLSTSSPSSDHNDSQSPTTAAAGRRLLSNITHRTTTFDTPIRRIISHDHSYEDSKTTSSKHRKRFKKTDDEINSIIEVEKKKLHIQELSLVAEHNRTASLHSIACSLQQLVSLIKLSTQLQGDALKLPRSTTGLPSVSDISALLNQDLFASDSSIDKPHYHQLD
ncbi:unnamed protein product [Didymodactylos carnosus]|uniref:G-protein coupled receptors family 1 profile domain-containing protein n=1 Tax=Didymodactylos carnosus TaxID=1234261 RepID=A0A8S2MLR4_9BILA|nr:unnamed protein product [Didymodactylos carnosus]CAF3959693.1 unnamed protein product [Didymodactylos carnosus]